MKKVLAVIPSLSLGGAEKAFILWVEELQNLGFKIIVATTQPEDDFFSLPKDTVHFRKSSFFHKNKALRLFFRLGEPFSNASFLKGIIRENKVDIVISHLPKSNIPSIIASQSERIPCLIMEHLYQKNLKDPLLNFLRKRLYPKSQSLIVLTPAMRNLFFSLNKNILEIANPIPIPPFVFPFEKKESIILLVGRLNDQKQYKQFIRNLDYLPLGHWKVYIVGEGEERSSLEELILEKNLQDRVVLWGAQKNMEPFYQKASIFVLCSKREGFSLVLAESALYGCARVSFNCPTGPEIMIKNNVNGFLVEDQNWLALMGQIKFLMNDKKKREEIYKESLIPHKNFDPKLIALKWKELINKFI